MLLTFDLSTGFHLPVFFLVVYDSSSVVLQTEGWQVFAMIAAALLLSLDVFTSCCRLALSLGMMMLPSVAAKTQILSD